MKRDIDLVRAVLLKVEGFDLPPGSTLCIYPSEPELEIDGYDADQVAYHLNLLIDAGFIQGARTVDNQFLIEGLTWNGHEFLADTVDPTVWSKTKERAKTVTGVGVQFLWEIAKAEIKTKLGLP
jgi:Hypothetical protein (DUF2513)